MSKNLVIVESPAKAKTIEKFLGKDFKVVSSNGHISDLPSSELGINVDENYKPKYIISKEKKDIVKRLKSEVKNVETVWLASDEDREGEAIAWHLQESLNLNEEKTKRIVFREITEDAIKKAITNPRKINKSLVDAQQARRVLDRLVGYKISPILWRKVKGGLSAGRVQSVALRLIAEREKEINDHVPNESFKISAFFNTVNGKIFKAKYSKNIFKDENFESFINEFLSSKYKVISVTKNPTEKKPTPPFTTSTLQQEASRKLGFSVSRTMSAAQKLYEQGHITYMRTDSVNLSNQAVKSIKKTIIDRFGVNYFFERSFKNKTKSAQQAHEAVRPTNFSNDHLILDSDQSNLYKLIWKRAVSSQMANAKLNKTIIKIKDSMHNDFFQTDGEVVVFDGFLKLYIESKDNIDENDNNDLLPKLNVGDTIEKNKILITQVFSKPPFRFSEATLVKKLEELGIGRPSTYAPTISTIINRKYVFKGDNVGQKRDLLQYVVTDKISKLIVSENFGSNKGKLVPSEVGLLVNEFLTNNFSNIIDYNFTASVEDDFDSIASGKKEWQSIIDNFYNPFNLKVDDVIKNAKRETGERVLGDDPKTGRQLSVKLGKFGPIAQIGKNEDEEKPIFASLLPEQQISKITFNEAIKLFDLPIYLGDFQSERVEANIGRYGPYVKHGKKFISIPDGSPFDISYEIAVELIKKKIESEKPIITYKGHGVTKGKGRFGPFIKWNGMFINVNKTYDFDNLSDSDYTDLIEEKIKKEKEKIIKNWSEDKITLEKGRWGKIFVIKGKKKIQIPKTVDPQSIDLEQAKKLLKK